MKLNYLFIKIFTFEIVYRFIYFKLKITKLHYTLKYKTEIVVIPGIL